MKLQQLHVSGVKSRQARPPPVQSIDFIMIIIIFESFCFVIPEKCAEGRACQSSQASSKTVANAASYF